MALSVGEPVNARLSFESNASDMLNPQTSKAIPAASMAIAIMFLLIEFSFRSKLIEASAQRLQRPA
jgi:hypothetical protein